EDVGIVEVLVERAPRSLEEECVSDRECRFADEILLSALDREDDEVAALGDHARKRGFARESGAWRDDDLRGAASARQQAFRLDVEPILLDERPRMSAEVTLDRPRGACREQPLAEEDDD